jgi:uncharacterized membrane protein
MALAFFGDEEISLIGISNATGFGEFIIELLVAKVLLNFYLIISDV